MTMQLTPRRFLLIAVAVLLGAGLTGMAIWPHLAAANAANPVTAAWERA